MRVRPPRRTRTATRARTAARALAAAVPLLLLAPSTPATAVPATAVPVTAVPVTISNAARVPVDDPTLPLVQVTEVTPGVVTDGSPVTLSVSIQNVSGSPLSTSLAQVRLGAADLTTASAIHSWFAGADAGVGEVLAQSPSPEIASGMAGSLTVSVPGLINARAEPFGMVPLTVTVAGSTVHTAVGYQRLKEYEPLSIAVLAEVVPQRTPDLAGPPGDARTAAWQSAFADGAFLSRVAKWAAVPNVQLAVDPTLLGVAVAPDGQASLTLGDLATGTGASASTPSSGASSPGPATSSPRTASGAPSATVPTPAATVPPSAPGSTPQESALRARFGRELVTTLAGSDPLSLPGADLAIDPLIVGPPDATTLGRAQALLDAADLATAMLDGQGLLLWPNHVPSVWSAQRAEQYRRLLAGRPASIIVAADSLQWSSAVGRNAGDGITLLAVDTPLSGTLSGVAHPGGSGSARQQFIALTLARLLETPGLAHSVLIAADTVADPAVLDVLQVIPWVQPTTVTTLRTQATQAPAGAGTDPAGPALGTTIAEIDANHHASWAQQQSQVTTLREQAATAASIRADGPAINAEWADRIDQLMSAAWGPANLVDAIPQAVAQQALTDEIGASGNGVRVNSQTISFLADRGRLQLTVVNELTVPVADIRIQLTSDSPRLVVPAASAPLSIAPRSRATVTFDATAYAAGPVRLEARVLAPDGTPVGSPTSLEVSVSPTSQWVYWALGAVAALIFLLGMLNSRRKQRRRPDTPPTPSRPAPWPAASPEPSLVLDHPAADPADVLDPAAPVDPGERGLDDEIGAGPLSPTSPTDTGSRGVARSSLVMAAGTLTSRVLGLVRATLLASIIGLTGYTADAFGVANTLPNQFYLILAGGVFNAVLVPQIVKASSHKDGGDEFVSRLVTLGMALLFVATIATTCAAPWLITLFSDFNDPQANHLATVFAYVCIPQIFFYGLYTLLGQILNARQRFGAYMWAPVVANIVALGGLLLFLALGFPRNAPPGDWSAAMIAVLAGSATLSIAMQAIFLVIPLRAMGFRYRPVWGFRGVGLGTASHVALWSFGAVVVSQLGFVVTSRVLTGATERARLEGVVAAGRNAFDNAFLLFMLPHSLITVSLVTALFTRMAGAAHESRVADLRADLGRGLRMPAVILVPGTVYGLVFAPVLTRAFYFHNDANQTNAVASVMITLFLGVVPYGWLYLSERFFFAHSDARTPFGIQLVVTSLATLGALAASRLDVERTAPGIGLGQSLAYAVGAVIGFTVIRRRIGRLGLADVLTAYARLLLPSVVAAGVVVGVVRLTVGDPVAQGPLFCLILALVAGVAVLGAALVGGSLLGVREVRDLLAPVLARLGRTPGPTA